MNKITHKSLFFVSIFGWLSFFFAFPSAAHSQAGRVDISFGVNFLPEDAGIPVVKAIAIQPDGKIVVAGDFRIGSRADIIRLNADGTLDTTFTALISGYGAADVEHLRLQGDGKILIAGQFDFVNGIDRLRIARLNYDGSVDISFVQSANGIQSVDDLEIQSDGRILLRFAIPGGYPATMRLNSDGTKDTTFAGGSISGFNQGPQISLASDGKFFVGGFFTYTVNQSTYDGLARYHADGTLDASFTASVPAGSYGSEAKEISGGKILVWGSFTSVNGVNRNGLAMLNSDGSLVTSFNPATSATRHIYQVEVQSDGKIVFLGYAGYPYYGSADKVIIGRLNADGSFDRSWHQGRGTIDYWNFYSIPTVTTMKIANGNKLLIGGKFFRFNGIPRTGLMQIQM